MAELTAEKYDGTNDGKNGRNMTEQVRRNEYGGTKYSR